MIVVGAPLWHLGNLPVAIDGFMRTVLGHWGTENQMHLALDVQFGEDGSPGTGGHVAGNLAPPQRLAANLPR